MRKLIGAPLLALLLVAFSLGTVAAEAVRADPRDFTLVNESSVTIAYAYVSSTDITDWNDDVLGDDVLPPGRRVGVTFTAFTPGTCAYDIKVVGLGGETGYLWAVDLCATATVTFTD
jgi:hypothetical protein